MDSTRLRQNAISGRFRVMPVWPNGIVASRPMAERNFEVQQLTGYASSTVSQGQWDRGVLFRGIQPSFTPNPRALRMYDPTDPLATMDVPRV